MVKTGKEKDSKRKSNPKPAISTLKFKTEREIAMDFATKICQKFDKLVKSVILFGSQAKNKPVVGSDIDIIVVVDDVSLKWDNQFIIWYREELGNIIKQNPYKKELHINTVKLTTWWRDLLRGDSVVINVLRYGESLADFGGFFLPLKILLQNGDIKPTPESIYTALQRAPLHLARSEAAQLGSIEGLYWAAVDSSHAALMAAKKLPPSPEHVPIMLKEMFVDKGYLKMKYVIFYRDLYDLHRKIAHGEVKSVGGVEIDELQKRTDEFIREMALLIKKIIK